MIDTVVLLLPAHQFHIHEPQAFTPSAHLLSFTNANTRTLQAKQNPTKRELRSGVYKPRLTLAYRATPNNSRELALKIELSLPKLLFGNNFVELQYKDFARIIIKLQEALRGMGVEVTQEALSCASVITIHYAKNIALTDGSTPYHYIQKIKDANLRMSLDTNQTDYRNAGHSYKWHCNTYEVAFYDKIKDLEKAAVSDKRAIEKDNALQVQLLEDFKKRRRKFELLRMEVRLNKRQKIKQLLKTVDAATELTFKKLFKPALAKRVLLHYIDELEAQRPPLLNYKMRDGKALLADLIMNNPTLGPKQILQLYGLKQALEIMTPRELRAMFANYNQRSWYRLIAEAAKVNLPAVISPFKEIREQLNAFKAVKSPFVVRKT